MVFKKTYWLLYLLIFLAGARRQILIAFADFLLVRNFYFSVQAIASLFLLNNLVIFFLSPFIVQYIAKFGERKVLSIEYRCHCPDILCLCLS